MRRGDARVEVPKTPSATGKAMIAERCDAFIRDTLIPRCLPEIRPQAEWNYPIALRGAWHGSAYRFLQRWRTGTSRTPVQEWEDAHARLLHHAGGRFDVAVKRHTGQWWTLAERLPLEEALPMIAREPLPQPIPGG